MKQDGKLFILYGPSGAGKSTLMAAILKKFTQTLFAVITHTTRPARPHETHGKDYYFMSHEEFLIKQNQGSFIHVTTYLHNRYGASHEALKGLAAGKNLIAIFDRAGAREAKHTLSNTQLIFITAPLSDLKDRLAVRYSSHQEEYEMRINAAHQEILAEQNQPLADYTIVNIQLNQAFKELEFLIKKEIEHVTSSVY